MGVSAVFIARNRFAVLDKAANTIQIRNLQNEITKKCAPPCATTDAIFYAGTGVLLCRSEDKVRKASLLTCSSTSLCLTRAAMQTGKSGAMACVCACVCMCEQVILFDIQQRSTLAELSTPAIKYVSWNGDMSMVAMTSKHAIIIADKNLQNTQTVS